MLMSPLKKKKQKQTKTNKTKNKKKNTKTQKTKTTQKTPPPPSKKVTCLIRFYCNLTFLHCIDNLLDFNSYFYFISMTSHHCSSN
jgi:hypothetical protein